MVPRLKNLLYFLKKAFLLFRETFRELFQKTSYILGRNFPSLKNKKNLLCTKVLRFRKWNFLVPSLKNFSYFRREIAKSEKQPKNRLRMNFLSLRSFTIFTAVKHRTIRCDAKIQHRYIIL